MERVKTRSQKKNTTSNPDSPLPVKTLDFHQTLRRNVSKACQSCNLSHLKCSGGLPCERCKRSHRQCGYAPRQKKKTKTSNWEHYDKETLSSQPSTKALESEPIHQKRDFLEAFKKCFIMFSSSDGQLPPDMDAQSATNIINFSHTVKLTLGARTTFCLEDELMLLIEALFQAEALLTLANNRVSETLLFLWLYFQGAGDLSAAHFFLECSFTCLENSSQSTQLCSEFGRNLTCVIAANCSKYDQSHSFRTRVSATPPSGGSEIVWRGYMILACLVKFQVLDFGDQSDQIDQLKNLLLDMKPAMSSNQFISSQIILLACGAQLSSKAKQTTFSSVDSESGKLAVDLMRKNLEKLKTNGLVLLCLCVLIKCYWQSDQKSIQRHLLEMLKEFGLFFPIAVHFKAKLEDLRGHPGYEVEKLVIQQFFFEQDFNF